MKKIKRVMPLVLCLFVINNSFTQTGYIKIGDIKGESVSRDHKDWVDVISFGMGIERGETASAGRQISGKVNFQDLVITKKLDKASPVLMIKTVTGEILPEVQLEIARADGKSNYTVTLKDVIITGISTTSGCDPKCETVEEVSFSYEKISWEYTDPKGSKVVSGYDVKLNKKL